MTKGRNTSVISIRLEDEIVDRLNSLRKKRRLSMTELLKPVINNFALRGYIPTSKFETYDFNEMTEDEMIEDAPDLSEHPDYWDSSELSVNREYQDSPNGVTRNSVKIGRNDPCPCGSGLKYKKCCGK